MYRLYGERDRRVKCFETSWPSSWHAYSLSSSHADCLQKWFLKKKNQEIN